MNRAGPADASASDAFLRSLHSSVAPSDILHLDGAPARLPSDRHADVVLFTPTPAQCADRARLNVALTEALASMNAGAILYAVAPPRYRRTIARSLRRRGLTIGAPVVHLSSGEACYHVPLSGRCLVFAVRTWPQSWRWRPIIRLLKAVPVSGSLLSMVLPAVGFSACRPGVIAFEWLLSRLDVPDESDAIVATSWRGPGGATLIFAFSGSNAEPDLVAKLASPALRAAIRHEADMIEQVAPTAQAAGVRVPRMLEYSETAARGLLLQTAVPGQPLSTLLGEDPGQLDTIVARLSTWLTQWHRDTVTHVKLTAEHCEQLILAPVRSLVAELDRGREYLAWLSQASSGFIGRAVPFVCAHNDLTMSNVLRDSEGRIGVVDWETARPDGLPLADFWYSICDAAAATGNRDRPSIFDECFARDGHRRALVAPHEQQLRAAVGNPDEWLDLCFHACWLQHAANERVQDSQTGDRPFLAIAGRLMELALRKN